ncbi:MAG TPA: hypothetical protein VKI65_05465 [Gemmataceae bacterium]|nr:hypothetical protein [Gemmataceae bacterium]
MQLQGSDCSVESIDNAQRLGVDSLFELSKESFDGWKIGTGNERAEQQAIVAALKLHLSQSPSLTIEELKHFRCVLHHG